MQNVTGFRQPLCALLPMTSDTRLPESAVICVGQSSGRRSLRRFRPPPPSAAAGSSAAALSISIGSGAGTGATAVVSAVSVGAGVASALALLCAATIAMHSVPANSKLVGATATAASTSSTGCPAASACASVMRSKWASLHRCNWHWRPATRWQVGHSLSLAAVHGLPGEDARHERPDRPVAGDLRPHGTVGRGGWPRRHRLRRGRRHDHGSRPSHDDDLQVRPGADAVEHCLGCGRSMPAESECAFCARCE